MAPGPEATVVIPTRNRWALLSRALAGALAQEDVDHEVVVVDDGSSDETPARLAALDDPRLTVLRRERGSGVARARNAGIAAAGGAWIAFLDDDDVWSPRRLRVHLDAAAAMPGAVLAYGPYVTLDADYRSIRVSPAPDPETLPRLVRRTNPLGGPSTFMARTDVLRRIGGFDEELSALADWDLVIRLVDAGPAAASGAVEVGYVEHGENMMVTRAEEVLLEFERLRSKHARAAGDAFGDLWLAQWSAIRHRRSGRRFRAAGAHLRRALLARSRRDVARALVALLGERAHRAARRAGGGREAEPDWLRAYR